MHDFFVLLAACLQAIADEIEIDIADIREVESVPNAVGDGWCMHINDEQFACIKMFRGKPDVRFTAWYSDYAYLLEPGGAI